MIWKANPVSEKGNALSAEFGGRQILFLPHHRDLGCDNLAMPSSEK